MSNDIIDIITPLLLQIEKRGLILNYSQFLDMLNDFSKNLSLDEKNTLFGPNKHIIQSKEVVTFRPRLNSKSIHLCESMQKTTNEQRIEELVREKKIWRQREKIKKEIKDKSELEECTFKPKVRTTGLNTKIAKYTSAVKSKLGSRTAR